MRLFPILLLLIPLLLTGSGMAVTGCQRGGPEKAQHGEHAPLYTCPMHPGIRQDRPGDCPICGMRLVPLAAELPAEPPGASEPHAGHAAGATTDTTDRAAENGVYISPERQQLIGVKTLVIAVQPARQEIRTVGHVAFDPDLMIAQREYIEALRLGDRSLIEAVVLHLQHMGISEAELGRLRQTRKESHGLFLPKKGDSVWIYAPLYEHELPAVTPGMRAIVSLQSGGPTFEGTIRSIDPIIDPKTRSARARIEIPHAGGTLRPDTYVNTAIVVDHGMAITVPTTAVIDTGTRILVIRRHGKGHFEPVEIETGVNLGDAWIVRAGLQEGDVIVARATFLVNSESSLKSALGAPESAPSGGHQH
ncbi:MAG: efflux RND transporter periplasmic adaptor subunit [Deltaproteobacteria bacterium]|nr:efflux RND transporter periplasmic adaptor subunit [Deltaproteobacteria bacterium]